MKLLKKGTKLKFKSVDDNGFPFEAEGVVKGYGEDVRKLSPEEYGEAPDDCYLVSIISASGVSRLEVIDYNQILEIKKEEK